MEIAIPLSVQLEVKRTMHDIRSEYFVRVNLPIDRSGCKLVNMKCECFMPLSTLNQSKSFEFFYNS